MSLGTPCCSCFGVTIHGAHIASSCVIITIIIIIIIVFVISGRDILDSIGNGIRTGLSEVLRLDSRHVNLCSD
jgi:hypothetical protein